MTRESFAKYKDSITKLIMAYVNPKNSARDAYFDMGIFSLLYRLEVVILSNLNNVTSPEFPPSLKVLETEWCFQSNKWKLDHLESLEKMSAANNLFETLPTFHELAPIKYLDFLGNPLRLVDVKLETLARYCQLEYIRLPVQSNRDGDDATSYCHCKFIEWWLKSTKVEFESLKCRNPARGMVVFFAFDVIILGSLIDVCF